MTAFDALPTKLKPLQLKATDVEAWLLQRDPRAIGAYHSLGPQEYARSFAVAQTAGADVIDDMYFGLVDVISRGGTEADYSDLVTPILKQKGWLQGDDGAIAKRVQLIYDTNLRLARASGRWTRYRAVSGSFPYLRAFTVGDERVRHPPKSPHSDHRAWDGIILPIEHDFWTRWWPPLGFRCRCGVMQLSRSDLARYKHGITTEADLADREARLGAPVFLSPAAPFEAQIGAIVEGSNPEPMPGRPPLRASTMIAAGDALWNNVLAAQAVAQVTAALAALFGE